jgi:mediator of RNA polymerase II transcription subunit 31
MYLNYLAVQKMFDKPDFVAYLSYLQYFKQPAYVKYLQYVIPSPNTTITEHLFAATLVQPSEP